MLDRWRHRGSFARPHGAVTRLLHWSTAALLVWAYLRNGEVTGALLDAAAMHSEVLFGIAVALVFAARFAWVHGFGGASRLPADSPRWEGALSRLVHRALYLGVAAIVVSGLAIAWLRPGAAILASGDAVRVRTDSAALDAALAAHQIAANGLVLLAGLHVAAALWHRLVRRDGVWQSMVGRRRGRAA